MKPSQQVNTHEMKATITKREITALNMPIPLAGRVTSGAFSGY
jgi:hypothetical protein